MKKIVSVLLALTACGAKETQTQEPPAPAAAETAARREHRGSLRRIRRA